MSVAEIKAELPKLTPAERQEIANALEAIALENDPEWQKETEQRIAKAKSGGSVSREEVMRLCELPEEKLP